jgi:predicted acyl esterase
LAGPIRVDLRVATSGTDSDWVVKLIDVFPPDAKNYPSMATGKQMGGYQMLVRSEVIRGRYRNSYERPVPFTANEPAKVPLELQDVLHTFQKGHRLMIQVQSTWFPLVDRNPQKYVPNIYKAEASDFIKATQRVYRSRKLPTKIEVSVLPAETK